MTLCVLIVHWNKSMLPIIHRNVQMIFLSPLCVAWWNMNLISFTWGHFLWRLHRGSHLHLQLNASIDIPLGYSPKNTLILGRFKQSKITLVPCTPSMIFGWTRDSPRSNALPKIKAKLYSNTSIIKSPATVSKTWLVCFTLPIQFGLRLKVVWMHI